MSEGIRFERQSALMIVKLDRGVTNAIDGQLVQELSRILAQVRDDPQIRGLVLASANDKFFSIGLDIPHLLDLSKEDLAVFYRAFNCLCLHLFALPKPTIAAITGHAIRAGCILALCCDYRYVSSVVVH